ncbi:MAG: hypothetical protein CMP77_07715 [Flavobacterium sp.]|nr:hypothetical protein [Flavobacterium sp.]
MKFYYVYILRCFDGTFYTGITNNVEARLNQHNAGLNPESYTYTRRPVNLEYIQEFTDPAQAIAFEKKFKKWSKAKKEALIKNDFDAIQALAECRNASHSKYKP